MGNYEPRTTAHGPIGNAPPIHPPPIFALPAFGMGLGAVAGLEDRCANWRLAPLAGAGFEDGGRARSRAGHCRIAVAAAHGRNECFLSLRSLRQHSISPAGRSP